MTLIGAILNKVKSQDTVTRRCRSPPPELVEIPQRKKKKAVNKVRAVVDSAPPTYDSNRLLRGLPTWRRQVIKMAAENARLVMAIKMAYFNRGRVDCRWRSPPPGCGVHYETRRRFLRDARLQNLRMHTRITNAIPRVDTAAALHHDWLANRREILRKAQKQFVLFPPVPAPILEDLAFTKPPGVKRTRVYLSIGFRGGALIGELKVELFDEVCPATCRLFLELVDGDQSGYGYVGTRFFRKVPGLFWSGGDVVLDNGLGCFAQRGRSRPIGAENFHFPHSMPGLLSMRVTRDDEVCGNYNITFKPLPQFDMRNVVFGRVIRPCAVYEAMRVLGDAFSPQPVVALRAARRCVHGTWRSGANNDRLQVYDHRQYKRDIDKHSMYRSF